METAFEQGKVECRLMTKKARPPDPGFSLCGLFREDKDAFGLGLGEYEIAPVVAIPFALWFQRYVLCGGCRDASQKQGDEKGLHGFGYGKQGRLFPVISDGGELLQGILTGENLPGLRFSPQLG